MWIHSLNKWVIRCENLKKYTVLQEIGKGGQATVYKVFKQTNPSQLDEKNNAHSDVNNIPYAMKVISKEVLLGKSEFE